MSYKGLLKPTKSKHNKDIPGKKSISFGVTIVYIVEFSKLSENFLGRSDKKFPFSEFPPLKVSINRSDLITEEKFTLSKCFLYP